MTSKARSILNSLSIKIKISIEINVNSFNLLILKADLSEHIMTIEINLKKTSSLRIIISITMRTRIKILKLILLLIKSSNKSLTKK